MTLYLVGFIHFVWTTIDFLKWIKVNFFHFATIRLKFASLCWAFFLYHFFQVQLKSLYFCTLASFFFVHLPQSLFQFHLLLVIFSFSFCHCPEFDCRLHSFGPTQPNVLSQFAVLFVIFDNSKFLFLSLPILPPLSLYSSFQHIPL